MLRTLEIAWLCFTILSLCGVVIQYFREGWENALWMVFVTCITFFMYTIRRKQRIRYDQKDEKELYH